MVRRGRTPGKAPPEGIRVAAPQELAVRQRLAPLPFPVRLFGDHRAGGGGSWGGGGAGSEAAWMRP